MFCLLQQLRLRLNFFKYLTVVLIFSKILSINLFIYNQVEWYMNLIIIWMLFLNCWVFFLLLVSLQSVFLLSCYIKGAPASSTVYVTCIICHSNETVFKNIPSLQRYIHTFWRICVRDLCRLYRTNDDKTPNSKINVLFSKQLADYRITLRRHFEESYFLFVIK